MVSSAGISGEGVQSRLADSTAEFWSCQTTDGPGAYGNIEDDSEVSMIPTLSRRERWGRDVGRHTRWVELLRNGMSKAVRSR